MKNFLILLLTLGAYCHLEAQTTPPQPPTLITPPGLTQVMTPPAAPPISSINVPAPIGAPYDYQTYSSIINSTSPPSYSIVSQSSNPFINTITWNFTGTFPPDPNSLNTNSLTSVKSAPTFMPGQASTNTTTWNINNGQASSITQVNSGVEQNTTTNTFTLDTNNKIDSVTQTIAPYSGPFVPPIPGLPVTWNYANGVPFSYTGPTGKPILFPTAKTSAIFTPTVQGDALTVPAPTPHTQHQNLQLPGGEP